MKVTLEILVENPSQTAWVQLIQSIRLLEGCHPAEEIAAEETTSAYVRAEEIKNGLQAQPLDEKQKEAFAAAWQAYNQKPPPATQTEPEATPLQYDTADAEQAPTPAESEFYYLYAAGSPDKVLLGKYDTDVVRDRDEVADITPIGFILVTHDRNMNVVNMEERTVNGFAPWAKAAPVAAATPVSTVPFEKLNGAGPQPVQQVESAPVKLNKDGSVAKPRGRRPKTLTVETPEPQQDVQQQQPEAAAPAPIATAMPLPAAMQHQHQPPHPPHPAPPAPAIPTPFGRDITAPTAPAMPTAATAQTAMPSGDISLEDLKALAATAFKKDSQKAFGLLRQPAWSDGTPKGWSVFTIDAVPVTDRMRLAAEYAAIA